MKILLTGSSGYIGNNFSNNYNNKYSFEKFSLQTQNLEDIDFYSISTVLHCAALVHKKDIYTQEEYSEINTLYPMKLAQQAKKNGVKQFIFISTIAVYGENYEFINENSHCIPHTLYAISKLNAENEILKLHDKDFIVSIIRPPMVYGKDAPGNIDSLVEFIKKSSLIPLGGIENKRSFIYIGNLCYLINTIVEKQQGGLFLVSDDNSISTTKLIKLIANGLHKKVYLIKIPFFESLLKLVKPSFHKRLFESLEVDNTQSMHKLFGEVKTSLPYSVEDGIRFMIRGETG